VRLLQHRCDEGAREPVAILGALYCTHSGRHTGTFFGLPATGREFAYKQMHMIRMEDGRSVEHWVVRDDAGLMRQLTV
jgi:predicted ester cyclase